MAAADASGPDNTQYVVCNRPDGAPAGALCEDAPGSRAYYLNLANSYYDNVYNKEWQLNQTLYNEYEAANSAHEQYQKLRSKADSLWKQWQDAQDAATAAGNALSLARTTYGRAKAAAGRLTQEAAQAGQAANSAENEYQRLKHEYDQQQAAKNKPKKHPGPVQCSTTCLPLAHPPLPIAPNPLASDTGSGGGAGGGNGPGPQGSQGSFQPSGQNPEPEPQPAAGGAGATSGGGSCVGPASIPQVDNPFLQYIVNGLYKGVGNPKRVGDGTAMAAASAEANGASSVEDGDHINSTLELRNGLRKFLTNDTRRIKGGRIVQIVRTPRDIEVANSLISAIGDAQAGNYISAGNYPGLGGC